MTAKTRWWALTAVSLATLMCYLDNNVVNVALPTIERSLHLSVSGLEWIVSASSPPLSASCIARSTTAPLVRRARSPSPRVGSASAPSCAEEAEEEVT